MRMLFCSITFLFVNLNIYPRGKRHTPAIRDCVGVRECGGIAGLWRDCGGIAVGVSPECGIATGVRDCHGSAGVPLECRGSVAGVRECRGSAGLPDCGSAGLPFPPCPNIIFIHHI
jgi:hypothetical protein